MEVFKTAQENKLKTQLVNAKRIEDKHDLDSHIVKKRILERVEAGQFDVTFMSDSYFHLTNLLKLSGYKVTLDTDPDSPSMKISWE